MDPVTISLLAQAGLGVGSAIGSALDPHARAQAKRRRHLEGRERRGTLGLTGAEREAMVNPQLDALRTATTQQFGDYARLGAATGSMRSAADMERARLQQAEAIGAGAREIARGAQQADLHRADQQRAELEGLRAAAAQRRADIAGNLFGTLGSAAAAAGKIKGDVPEVERAATVAGNAIEDWDSYREDLISNKGWDPRDVAVLEQYWYDNQGDLMGGVLNGIAGGDQDLIALLQRNSRIF